MSAEDGENSPGNATASESDNFETSEDETIHIEFQEESRKKVPKGPKYLNQKILVTKKRIRTLVNAIRVLRQRCNDLPIKDEKLLELCMMEESDCDTSSEQEEEIQTVNPTNYQESVVNLVQVTLLGENGDRHTRELEKKVEMAAERDVALSQEILNLKNNVFLKTQHIESLKSDVATLKDQAETQIFGP